MPQVFIFNFPSTACYINTFLLCYFQAYYASTGTEKTINKEKEGKREEERTRGLKGGRGDRWGVGREGDRRGKDKGRRGREEGRERQEAERGRKRTEKEGKGSTTEGRERDVFISAW